MAISSAANISTCVSQPEQYMSAVQQRFPPTASFGGKGTAQSSGDTLQAGVSDLFGCLRFSNEPLAQVGAVGQFFLAPAAVLTQQLDYFSGSDHRARRCSRFYSSLFWHGPVHFSDSIDVIAHARYHRNGHWEAPRQAELQNSGEFTEEGPGSIVRQL